MECKEIQLNLKKQKDDSYSILIGKDLFETLREYISNLENISSLAIITDDKVKSLYGEKLVNVLKTLKLNVNLISFPQGEKNKTWETVIKLQEEMIDLNCGRDTLVVALGGGVVGDIAGFVAATYTRGLPFVQIPTTLLSMVDSSVGGKTGFNTKKGKNLIGAFYQPKQVIVDIGVLDTLEKDHVVNGLIEALKMFLTHDKDSFLYIKENIEGILTKDSEILLNIIESAVKIKAQVVENDEKESNERMVLNLGHTIGHAIEKLSKYEMLHGFAVALGILVESKISNLLGILSDDDYEKIEKVVELLGIKKEEIKKYTVEDILGELKLDKKSRNGIPKFVLLENIGKVYKKDGNFAHEVDEKIIIKALNSF